MSKVNDFNPCCSTDHSYQYWSMHFVPKNDDRVLSPRILKDNEYESLLKDVQNRAIANKIELELVAWSTLNKT